MKIFETDEKMKINIGPIDISIGFLVEQDDNRVVTRTDKVAVTIISNYKPLPMVFINGELQNVLGTIMSFNNAKMMMAQLSIAANDAIAAIEKLENGEELDGGK